MVQTVKDMLEGFSEIQIWKAKEAHELKAKVSHLSTQDLKNIIKSNMIMNCPMSVADVE
jgi:hypothetical protein